MAETNKGLTDTAPTQIKAAELPDANEMASCHIESFPGRFMTKMGPRWLKALYSYFIEQDDAISLVAVDASGKIVGLAVGGRPDIRKEFLRKAMIRYPHIIFWKFLTNSFVRKRLLKELFSKIHTHHNASNHDASNANTAEIKCGNLLSIAVYPRYQGTGTAGRLIESFRQAGTEKGYDILELHVFNDNSRAIKFYKKHNWYEVSKQQTQTRFRLNLNSN